MSSALNPDHQNKHLSAKISFGLERLYEAYRISLSREARRYQLSPVQLQILIFIRHHSPAHNTLSYLSREFSLTKATLSQSIKTLEEKDLLHKKINPADSRSQFLNLSPRAITLLEQSESFMGEIETAVDVLSGDEQQIFWKGLKSVLLNLRQQGLIDIQRMCLNCRHYAEEKGQARCNLLKISLRDQDIRFDCPEHLARNPK